MKDYKHLVHHDDDGRRIFYKPQPFLSTAWDWFWCAALLVMIYLLLTVLGG